MYIIVSLRVAWGCNTCFLEVGEVGGGRGHVAMFPKALAQLGERETIKRVNKFSLISASSTLAQLSAVKL